LGRPQRTSLSRHSPSRVTPPWIIKRAKYLHDYVVEFTFADGLKREIDLKPFIRGAIWRGWEAPEAFRRFRVSGGTISWPDGPDIAPETLYYGLGPVPYEDSPSNSQGA
jgi:hypothetical protein